VVLVEVARSPFEVIHNVKLYSIEFQQSCFDYADAMRRLMQQKLHVLMQCAPSRAQGKCFKSFPRFLYKE